MDDDAASPIACTVPRGPSPEPRIEDSECHRSQSAMSVALSPSYWHWPFTDRRVRVCLQFLATLEPRRGQLVRPDRSHLQARARLQVGAPPRGASAPPGRTRARRARKGEGARARRRRTRGTTPHHFLLLFFFSLSYSALVTRHCTWKDAVNPFLKIIINVPSFLCVAAQGGHSGQARNAETVDVGRRTHRIDHVARIRSFRTAALSRHSGPPPTQVTFFDRLSTKTNSPFVANHQAYFTSSTCHSCYVVALNRRDPLEARGAAL